MKPSAYALAAVAGVILAVAITALMAGYRGTRDHAQQVPAIFSPSPSCPSGWPGTFAAAGPGCLVAGTVTLPPPAVPPFLAPGSVLAPAAQVTP